MSKTQQQGIVRPDQRPVTKIDEAAWERLVALVRTGPQTAGLHPRIDADLIAQIHANWDAALRAVAHSVLMPAEASAWKETVRDIFDLTYADKPPTAAEVRALIERRHAAFFCGEAETPSAATEPKSTGSGDPSDAFPHLFPQPHPGDTKMSDKSIDTNLINHMVSRFLSWPLPANFAPDAGITYAGKNHPNHPGPSGTNLLDAGQAKAMVRYMLDGLPSEGDPPPVRKVVQITTLIEGQSGNQRPWLTVHALCDDGSIWRERADGHWKRLADIPQD